MPEPVRRPKSLKVNAWTGRISPEGAPASANWGVKKRFAGTDDRQDRFLAAPKLADPRDWRHPDIGWGLVLPDNAALSHAERATADDAEEPLRRLVAARGNAPVFRYRAGTGDNYLCRYFADGRDPMEPTTHASRPGLGDNRLPKYLLIAAGPEEIPWSVQYALNMWGAVGRLPLKGEPLRRYVDALLNDWADGEADLGAAVVWRVDHGTPDITWLMARVVAGKVWERLQDDEETRDRSLCLADGQATGAKLLEALGERKPSFVLTTSHGMTGPLDDPAAMSAQLGLLVDVEHAALPLDQASAWKPDGAIWYAHACCSAGSDGASRYGDLFAREDAVGEVLHGVADGAGARVSPLAVALLGAEKPLRAFVGHVEPTFDWTLRDPNNSQVVTHALQTCLYDRLYQPDRPPIGWALADLFDEAGRFFAAWTGAKRQINQGAPVRDEALYLQLVAMDRQSVVILGDPTVGLPKPKATP